MSSTNDVNGWVVAEKFVIAGLPVDPMEPTRWFMVEFMATIYPHQEVRGVEAECTQAVVMRPARVTHTTAQSDASGGADGAETPGGCL
jgi:hypothetical protein